MCIALPYPFLFLSKLIILYPAFMSPIIHIILSSTHFHDLHVHWSLPQSTLFLPMGFHPSPHPSISQPTCRADALMSFYLSYVCNEVGGSSRKFNCVVIYVLDSRTRWLQIPNSIFSKITSIVNWLILTHIKMLSRLN